VEWPQNHSRNVFEFSSEAILVLNSVHAFQKKSKSGIKTPRAELDKVKRRLKEAEKANLERV
jgi:phage-related protein